MAPRDRHNRICFICIFPHKKSQVLPFSDKTWARFLEYVTKWKNLEGPQADIAKNYLDARHSSISVQLPPLNGGFHKICYGRFADSQRVERTIKRLKKKAEDEAPKASTSQGDNTGKTVEKDEPPATKRPHLCPTSDKPLAPTRSKHVLPKICILCQQVYKSIVCKLTSVKKSEHLTRCTSIDAVKLKRAAADSGNQFLMQIIDQDCVALEVMYHHTCYLHFTRYLNKTTTSKDPGETSDNEAFRVISKIVQTRIIENKEIIRLKNLNDLFIKQIKETNGIDAGSHKTAYLKKRLIKEFPQLCFISLRMKSQGDIVYVNDIPTDALVLEKKVLIEETQNTTSETGSTENDTEVLSQTVHTHIDPRHLCNKFKTAMELKSIIGEVKPSLRWPPTAETLNLQEAERTVPPSLYNFLAWIVGASEKPATEKMVEVPAPIHRKLLSISQDIISLASKGRALMPKHLSLAMAVCHLSGSAQLIGLLNGFGHCVPNSVVLNHDRALAEREISRGENSLPSTIHQGIPTTLVWDNNDFGEKTLSGHGTTHNTNGIIIQSNVNPITDKPSSSSSPDAAAKRAGKRSIQPSEVHLAIYSAGKKEDPVPLVEHVSLLQSDESLLEDPMKLDLAYYMMKYSTDKLLPSWTVFNQLLSQAELQSKSVIGYLPVIDGSPTEMETVLTILQRSINIADKLKLETIVIVVDQASYSKAQQIRWKNPQFMERLVIRLGAFHTAMSFLGCLGKRFRDAGLQDILIESEVVSAGSVNGVFSGKRYNRAVRAHKLVAEAMQHMRLTAYLHAIPEEEADKVRQMLAALSQSFPGPQYQEMLKGESFLGFLSSYAEFVQANKKKQTFAFWSSYIDMVELLLLFLRGTREANWELHLASVRQMLPWVFAYDHGNYSRHLSVYWLEMSNLSSTHPVVHQQCLDGDFAVQRSRNAFAQIACDQTIEQTANRDSKAKGGTIGFSTSKGVTDRWIWSHHARGTITRECEEMAGKGVQTRNRPDLMQSHMKRDKSDVLKIVDTVNNMVNPFLKEDNELIHITSGVVATQDVQTDLQTAYARGESEFTNYCLQHLQTGELDLFASKKKLNSKTFSSISKVFHCKVRDKDVAIKTDRNLLARFFAIGRFRNIDLPKLLSYSLGPLPLSLATPHGTLVRTNKANLLDALESLHERPLAEAPIVGGIYVVDGMAFIHQLNINKLPGGERTFHNLALLILKCLVDKAKQNNSEEIHFVTGTYRQISIKNTERTRRAASGSQVIRIHGQSLPQQWKQFLSNRENKESLTEYLNEAWSKVSTSELRGVKVFLSHNRKCHSFSPGKQASFKVISLEETSLSSTQEEADTRMYLHASYAACNSSDVIIMSPDTDVFVIGIAMQSLIPANLYFHTGIEANLRTIDLQVMQDTIGDDISQALIGLHCFTGCDSISSFYGIGKKKALNLLLKEKQFCHAFKDLGEQFDVQPDTAVALEVFVCRLYGQLNITSVNEARYNMFRLQRKSEIAMPPNQDALREHIKRANYQAGIYKRSLRTNPDIPVPDGHGWKMEDGELAINWMNLPPAPESLLELTNCTDKCNESQCKDADICTCLQTNISCTDLCMCARNNCCTITGHDAVEDDSDDDTDDDDELEFTGDTGVYTCKTVKHYNLH